MSANAGRRLPCILVVDDHRGVRAVVRRLVETWGYASDEAVDSAGALERIDAGSVALVLTDCEMPGGDGLTLIRAVVARSEGGDWIPLILISGRGLENVAVEAVAAGASAILPKPFDAAFLRAAIDLFVRKRGTRA